MEAVARASIARSSHARVPLCRRPRPRHAARCLRGRSVACAAAADADVVRLFDAAKLTVDEFVKSGMVVGLGSGAASGLAVQYLGTRLRRGSLTGIVGIPSSVICASEAEKAGIKVGSHEEDAQIDFAFTDADVIEEGTLTAVIGRRKIETGEPSFIQEKVWRRPSIGTAGPSGGDFPLVTKEGHHILDVIFTTPIQDLGICVNGSLLPLEDLAGKVAEGLEKIAGVVDHGIICNTTPYAVIASKGEVQVLDQKSSVISNT